VSRSSVADVVVDGLKRAGSPQLFGVVGGDRHPLLDSARARDLPVTLASGETAACIMAAVAGDLVEAPGAALVESPTPEVGAAVERAAADRAPMIVLTGRHPGAGLAGKASLSAAPESAAHWIAHAARLAATSPRGPVHLEISADVARRQALPLATSCRPDRLPPPAPDALEAAAGLLAGASRPLLLAGAHCRGGDVQQWVRALVEALPAPMLVTYRAKGTLPDPHPLMLGVLEGEGVDERLLKLADLVVGLGLDALEPGPGPWRSTVPVLGIGPPGVLGDWVPAVEVTGDIAVILEELAPRLRDRERADWDVAELDRLKRRRSSAPAATDAARARREIVRIAREATPAGTIAVVDGGSHLADVAAGWHAVAPRELLASSWRAAPGFALPAAIATRVVRPDRRVVCFTGADGLATTASELETATRLGGPLVVIVLDGGEPGAADPIQLARSVRLDAFSADSGARFSEALSRAMRSGEPALIAAVAV
jgi:acetolactate synthase-1/2/3 large subunit